MNNAKKIKYIVKSICFFILIMMCVYIASIVADTVALGYADASFLTPTPTLFMTATPTPTNTPTPEPTATNTPSPTLTNRPTTSPTPTQSPTPTFTPTPSPTPTNTPIPTATSIPTPTITNTPTPTPTTHPLYNTYSEKELELLFRVVEAEVTGGSVQTKSHVASVIFNRLKDEWWGGDLTRNLMEKGQFSVVTSGRYLRVTITESTIKACELAFEQDTAHGALFFDSTDGNSWAHENRTFLFRDRAGHNFYK